MKPGWLREKMAQTPEKKVKDWVKKRLLDEFPKAYWYMPVPMGFGKKGVPDILVCINGKFIGIECKATKAGQVTAMQEKNLREIRDAGGMAWVVKGKDEILLEAIVATIGK